MKIIKYCNKKICRSMQMDIYEAGSATWHRRALNYVDHCTTLHDQQRQITDQKSTKNEGRQRLAATMTYAGKLQTTRTAIAG